MYKRKKRCFEVLIILIIILKEVLIIEGLKRKGAIRSIERNEEEVLKLGWSEVDVSFVMQYWGKENGHELNIPLIVERIGVCADELEKRYEILINFDNSRKDIKETRRQHTLWQDEISKEVQENMYILLSDDIHELRGYNILTRVSKGEVTILIQDDNLPPKKGCRWLKDTLKIFEEWPEVGTVGMRDALLYVVSDERDGRSELRRKKGGEVKEWKLESEVSLLIQYWGTEKNEMEKNIRPLMERIHRCGKKLEKEIEVLINIDSVNIRNGDIEEWMKYVGEKDKVMLSPNVHEARGYNRLSKMVTAPIMYLMQDDALPPKTGDCEWLKTPIEVLEKEENIGAISLKNGLFVVLDDDILKEEKYEMSNIFFKEKRARCSIPSIEGAKHIEAVRCVDIGPLVVRTSAFKREANGFDERISKRGIESSVEVDCGMEARMALNGNYASVYLDIEEKFISGKGIEHQAWSSEGMESRHYKRAHEYNMKYWSNKESCVIQKIAMDMNKKFICPSKKNLNKIGVFDCYIYPNNKECLLSCPY